MRRRRGQSRCERLVSQVLDDHQGMMDLSPHEIRSRAPIHPARKPDHNQITHTLKSMSGVWYNGDGRWYKAKEPRPSDKGFCPNCSREDEPGCCRWAIDRDLEAGLVPFYTCYSSPSRAIMLAPEEIIEVIEDFVRDDDEVEFEDEVAAEVERRFDQWKKDLRGSRWSHLYTLVRGTFIKPPCDIDG